MPESTAELLLEIGFEEMPASWLPGLTAQFERKLGELLVKENLDPTEVRTASTPRRLVGRAVVARMQADREEMVLGPALEGGPGRGRRLDERRPGILEEGGGAARGPRARVRRTRPSPTSFT